MLNKVIIDSMDKGASFKLRDIISKELATQLPNKKTIVILCIGTDRSTGDSLGPLVGERLRFLSRKNIYLYGNLENPIHAKNLEDTIKEINKKYKKPYVIAIDASLGNMQNVGKVIIERKPLCPGSALNKKLPKVGNLSISGIVNISGALEFMVLQNTRLYIVMKLAKTISDGLYHSILQTFGSKNISCRTSFVDTLKSLKQGNL